MALRRGVAMVATLLAVVSLGDLLRAVAAAPPVVVAGATLPMLVFVALVLRIGRHGDEPRICLLAAFVWGAAVAPFLSVHANDALLARAPALTPVLLAPVVEELAKSAGVGLLLLARPGGAGGGLAYGALVGLGFTMTENLGYLTLAAVQGGLAGLERAVWVRGVVTGAKHAVFTATAGVAFGWAQQSPARSGRAGLAVAGIVAAVLQHAVWNAVASQAISDVLCNAARPDGPCRAAPDPADLFLWTPLITLACLGPGVVVLAAIVHRLERRGAA